MDFRTFVNIPASDFQIGHTTRMMLFGSCFSENIGNKLAENKFRVNSNPFGILYNPLSVSATVRRLLCGAVFSETDIVFHNGLYQSFAHHGSFSHPEKAQCLQKIADSFTVASTFIRQTDVFLVTFGTAYVYRLKSSGSVVANCHKFPPDVFMRSRLSVQEITDDWSALIEELLSENSEIKIVFTVSPIRHLKDGAHENQLSKAALHLAIQTLAEKYPQAVRYFPAYEIVLDELRDYRFFAADMMHPSPTAADYVWERFSETYFSAETQHILHEWQPIHRALQHRALHGFTENYLRFLRQTAEKLDRFARLYPQVPCGGEIRQLSSLIQNNSTI